MALLCPNRHDIFSEFFVKPPSHIAYKKVKGVKLQNDPGDLTMKIRATVICERDRQVLLVRKPASKWALPGGKVELGEAIVGAAAQELQEETGLNAEQLLYMFEFETDRTLHHVFEAFVLPAENATPQNEIAECSWHPLSMLHDLNISAATQAILRSFIRRL